VYPAATTTGAATRSPSAPSAGAGRGDTPRGYDPRARRASRRRGCIVRTRGTPPVPRRRRRPSVTGTLTPSARPQDRRRSLLTIPVTPNGPDARALGRAVDVQTCTALRRTQRPREAPEGSGSPLYWAGPRQPVLGTHPQYRGSDAARSCHVPPRGRRSRTASRGTAPRPRRGSSPPPRAGRAVRSSTRRTSALASATLISISTGTRATRRAPRRASARRRRQPRNGKGAAAVRRERAPAIQGAQRGERARGRPGRAVRGAVERRVVVDDGHAVGERRTSNSSASAPRRTARSNAAIVFSGARADSPRWATRAARRGSRRITAQNDRGGPRPSRRGPPRPDRGSRARLRGCTTRG
jgi:hypothetical protein